MAIASAVAPNFSTIVYNSSGNVQTLGQPNLITGKLRAWTERLTLATQTVGSQIAIARIPYGSVPIAIVHETDTSLSSSSICYGDMNNVSRFAATGTFTSTNTPTFVGPNVATQGVQLTTCYDYAGVSNTLYEDVIVTTSISNLPASGTITFRVEYLEYNS